MKLLAPRHNLFKGRLGKNFSQERFFLWYRNHKKQVVGKNHTLIHFAYFYTEFQDHPFTKALSNSLDIWNNEYIKEKNHPLLMDVEIPPYNRKTYDSYLNKIYRQCYVENKNFPAPPKRGWINDTNFLYKINDLVRNKISCKFIDGPELIAKKLKDLATTHGLRSEYSSRYYDDGYYAYHFYVYFPIDITTGPLACGPNEVAVEIQISTQLKEVMYEILHKFYADDRSKTVKDDWKWDIGSLKFKSGYLSHTLHLLEAMIVELRNELHK